MVKKVATIHYLMTSVSKLDFDLRLENPDEGSGTSNLERLKLELDRTLCRLGISEPLTLEWQPQARSRLAGKVRDQTVYIYVQDLPSALATVRHEVVDYWLTQLLQAPLDWSDAAMEGLSDLIEAIARETELPSTLRVSISKLAGLINLYTQAFTKTIYNQKEQRVVQVPVPLYW